MEKEVELKEINNPIDNHQNNDESSTIDIIDNNNSNNSNNTTNNNSNNNINNDNSTNKNDNISTITNQNNHIHMVKDYFINYFEKWKGYEKAPKRADLEEIGWSWLSSFIGILVLALLHYRVLIDKEMLMLIGSFGASAVLIFGAPKSPLAQPRNLVGGHIISAIVGCTIRVALVYTNANIEVACALSVSLAIACMHFTTTLHPPGGATALIAVMSIEQRWRGYYYIFVPVASGSLIMLLTALLVNNFARKRKYPVYCIHYQNQIKTKSKIKSIFTLIREYFRKWEDYEKAPKRPDFEEIGWSWLSSFIGILVLALLHYRVLVEKEMLMLIGSFAASAVLIFAAPKSPLAQPRNLIFGHLFSSTGGATALIAVMSAEQRWTGYYYCLVPVTSGALIMLVNLNYKSINLYYQLIGFFKDKLQQPHFKIQ